LGKALQALSHADPAVCDAVLRGDDEVDQLYLDVERRILGLFALQTPVASDLRLLTALLHISLRLERAGDHARYDQAATQQPTAHPAVGPADNVTCSHVLA
jgi:phosphate transport system protein